MEAIWLATKLCRHRMLRMGGNFVSTTTYLHRLQFTDLQRWLSKSMQKETSDEMKKNAFNRKDTFKLERERCIGPNRQVWQYLIWPSKAIFFYRQR